MFDHEGDHLSDFFQHPLTRCMKKSAMIIFQSCDIASNHRHASTQAVDVLLSLRLSIVLRFSKKYETRFLNLNSKI